MSPKKTDEGVVSRQLCCEQGDEQRRIRDQRHGAGGKVFWCHGETSEHHDSTAHAENKRHAQRRETKGCTMGPRSCVHPWHRRNQEKAKRPEQPRRRKETQSVQRDGEIRHGKKVPAPYAVASGDSPLKLRGEGQNEQHWKGVTEQGVDER